MDEIKDLIKKLADKVQSDDEIKALIDSAYERSLQLLNDNMDAVERVAAYLLEHETMYAKEFELVFNGEPVPENINKTVVQTAPESEEKTEFQVEQDDKAETNPEDTQN